MNNLRLAISLLLVSFSCPPLNIHLQAQSLAFSRISASDGLSQNTIYTMLQDHQGFMWFGTEGGLNRFDGYEFIVYRHNPLDSNSISHSIILTLFEDRERNLWVGTSNGLDRFDRSAGHFERATGLVARDPIYFGGVWEIQQDRAGDLWFRTHAAGHRLQSLQRATGKIRSCKTDFQNSDTTTPVSVLNVHIDSVGRILVGTSQGLFSSSGKEHVFKVGLEVPGFDEFPNEAVVTAVHESSVRPNILWIGTGDLHSTAGGHGVYELNKKRGTLRRFHSGHAAGRALRSNFVTGIYENRDGLIWVGTTAGLSYFDQETQSFMRLPAWEEGAEAFSNDPVTNIFEDSQGDLWVSISRDLSKTTPSLSSNIMLPLRVQRAINYGIVRYERNTGASQHILNDESDPVSLSRNSVMSICYDRSGSVWIGTFTGGISRYDRNRIHFTNYTERQPFRENISSDKIRSVYIDPLDDGNTLWVGTIDAGLNRIDRRKKTIKQYSVSLPEPHSLDADRVNHIQRISTGTLWLATDGGGLHWFDDELETFTAISTLSDDTATISVASLGSFSEDPNNPGNLWVTPTSGGILRYNTLIKKSNYFDLGDIALGDVEKCGDGTIWMSTWGSGLIAFNPESGRITKSHRADPHNPDSLTTDFIMGLNCVEGGVLWVGTFDGGFLKFEIGAQRFVRFNTQNHPGLTNNAVYTVLVDDQNLWLPSDNGLFRLNTRSKNFTVFDSRDGLLNRGYNAGVGFKSPITGEIMVGGDNGAAVFSPASVGDTIAPDIFFTDVRLFNKSVEVNPHSTDDGNQIIRREVMDQGEERRFYLPKLPGELDELVISYHENVISFEFAALHYIVPEKNQYSYKLEGFNQNWIDLGVTREVTFTNLDPGEYTLRVRAANSDGHWNMEGTTLRLRVIPPWWDTWWAYTMYFMLVLAIVSGVLSYELRRQRLKERAEALRELDTLKTQFYTAISHEFRTPLTLILGPLEDLIFGVFRGELPSVYQKMRKHAQGLLKLVNDLLDLAKLEAGKLELQCQSVALDVYLKRIISMFESAALSKDIRVSFDSSDKNLAVFIDTTKMERVFNNLLANAMKFTPQGGRVEVLMMKPGGELADDEAQKSAPEKFVEVRVMNTGETIPGDSLDRVFEPWIQLSDNGHTSSIRGSGIGLATVSAIVGLHEGSVSARNLPGVGVEFIVKLPLGSAHLDAGQILEIPWEANDQPDVIPANQTTFLGVEPTSRKEFAQPNKFAASQTSVESAVVLVVEDNVDLCEYITMHIREKYRCIQASDGQEGIEMATEEIPDLIISDIMMPKVDGIQLCKTLKESRATSHIPIVLLTAKVDIESKIEGLEQGADDYLAKPFDRAELLARVENLIRVRQKLQAKYRKEIFLHSTEDKEQSPEKSFLQDITGYVSARLGDGPIDHDALANHLIVSRKQLSRKVNAITGESPTEFIDAIRLAHTKELITQGWTIGQAALECGYSSQAHFANNFRKKFGMTPSAWRKRQAKSK